MQSEGIDEAAKKGERVKKGYSDGRKEIKSGVSFVEEDLSPTNNGEPNAAEGDKTTYPRK